MVNLKGTNAFSSPFSFRQQLKHIIRHIPYASPMASLPEQPLQLSEPVAFDVTPLQRHSEFHHALNRASLAGKFQTAGRGAEQIIQVHNRLETWTAIRGPCRDCS
jgi:hypothetical protein